LNGSQLFSILDVDLSLNFDLGLKTKLSKYQKQHRTKQLLGEIGNISCKRKLVNNKIKKKRK